MPSRFYIIPSDVILSQTQNYHNRSQHVILWKAICRHNALMFALVFCFELRARTTRTYCHEAQLG